MQINARYPCADGAGYFIVDRSPNLGYIFGSDTFFSLLADQDDFIPCLGSWNPVQLYHNLVHGHTSDDRYTLPRNTHLVVRCTAESIRISNRDRCNLFLAPGRVYVPIADPSTRRQHFNLAQHGFPGQRCTYCPWKRAFIGGVEAVHGNPNPDQVKVGAGTCQAGSSM